MSRVLRRAATPFAASVLVCVWLAASTGAASASFPSWTTYHRDGTRSGVDPDSTNPVAPDLAWRTSPALDGDIYGQPLVYGGRVYVATENDSVYALDAATGAVVWHKNVGIPVPDRPTSTCGDIGNVGITSTPVIDPSTGRIFAVADTWDGSNASTIKHQLVGFNLADGSPAPGLPEDVDPAGSHPSQQLQRVGLALDAGRIIIGFGGNAGDCGDYHGRLVSVPEGGGPLASFEVEQNHDSGEGAIWGAGNAPAIDSAGNVLVSTGNGNSGSDFDLQESVVKLDPMMNVLDHWAPSNWLSLDQGDVDLGSSEPLLLPGGLVFAIGKEGVGYLLSESTLGGTGGVPVFSATICAAGSYGGGTYSGGVIYVACHDGLRAVALNIQTRSFAPVAGWSVNTDAIGPPIIAAGLVWSVGWNDAVLYGLSPTTGATRFAYNLGGFDHFVSPSAAGGRLFVANQSQVTAFTIATPPAPSATTTSIGASSKTVIVNHKVTFTAAVIPAPDSGTVSFSDAGHAIAGCAAVSVSFAGGGRASCTAGFARAGRHQITATFSGGAYYAGSHSSMLSEVVSSNAAAPVISGIGIAVSRTALTLRLRLSEAEKLTAAITQTIRGRRVRGRCVAHARRGPRCTASVRKAARTLNLASGRHTLKLSLRNLRPGRYTLVVSTRDRRGNKGRVHRLTFTVRGRPHR